MVNVSELPPTGWLNPGKVPLNAKIRKRYVVRGVKPLMFSLTLWNVFPVMYPWGWGNMEPMQPTPFGSNPSWSQ